MKNIIIVGGGFAGWYTAAFLTTNFPEIKIIVIDSDKHPRMGVGETFGWSSPYDQKRLLNLKDDRMIMWETGAIYKYGIQPVNFYNDDSHYHYGKFFNLKVKALANFFGTYEYSDYLENWNINPGDIGLLEAWLEINKDTDKTFKDYALETSDTTVFARYPYAPYQNNNYVLRPQEGWSYHMDVEKTVNLFKSLTKCTHYNLELRNINYGNQGIASIVLENNQILTADLFIDCTGFARVLTNKNPNFEWVAADQRFNNSACVVGTRYTNPQEQIIGSTSFHGEDQGWRFNIPLYHRQGNGYIFNDNLTDPGQILDHMNNLYATDSISEPRVIKWDPGYFKKSFVGNTLCMGVSSHFVDPFDGPSYDLHSRNLEDFLSHYDATDVDKFRDNFNTSHRICSEERVTRLVCTFGLSKKQGSYWDSRRDMFRDLGYDKKFTDIMNGEENWGNRYNHFWQQMYYRLCVIGDYDRTQLKSKHLADNDRKMAESFFSYFRTRNEYISSIKWPNYYEWLKENRFNGHTHKQVLDRIG